MNSQLSVYFISSFFISYLVIAVRNRICRFYGVKRGFIFGLSLEMAGKPQKKEADLFENFNFLMHHLHGCGIVLSAGDKNDGKTEDG